MSDPTKYDENYYKKKYLKYKSKYVNIKMAGGDKQHMHNPAL